MAQMEHLLALELDDNRRGELQLKFARIDAMAEPLMAFPLDERLEIAGVYKS
ncbi:oxalurate catabolism protein HpxX [Raoultella ornithinolytica]|uniref:oxalurate catabolism protein HpxX n=1 Tax=Raoultella ornithinolytica TaxID=54291 RepID=UPI001D113FCC|nr:oxalurate catabolism protein HpxX [Raoultella ornithinolytica]